MPGRTLPAVVLLGLAMLHKCAPRRRPEELGVKEEHITVVDRHKILQARALLRKLIACEVNIILQIT